MQDHSGAEEDWEVLSSGISRPSSPVPVAHPPADTLFDQDLLSLSKTDCTGSLSASDAASGDVGAPGDGSKLAASLSSVQPVMLSDQDNGRSSLLVAGNSTTPAPRFGQSPFAGQSPFSTLLKSDTDSLSSQDQSAKGTSSAPHALSRNSSSMSDGSIYDITHSAFEHISRASLSSPASSDAEAALGDSVTSPKVKLCLHPDTTPSNRLVYAALEFSEGSEAAGQAPLHQASSDGSSDNDMGMDVEHPQLALSSARACAMEYARGVDAEHPQLAVGSTHAGTMESARCMEDTEMHTAEDGSKQPVTLLLLGKTGNGKSSTGNTILGRRAFQAKCSARSVTTHSQAESAVFNDRTITVIDTPGLFDTAASQSQVCSELSRAMAMSEGGIHAILLVLTTTARFTAEEEACLDYLRTAYAGQLLRHCILVFTHGDSLEEEEMPLEEFLRNCPESLQVVLDEVAGRQVVVNNKAGRSNGQVETLLGHVDALLASNGNSLFTPSHEPAPFIEPVREADSLAELEQLRVQFDNCEAARRDLEKRVREAGTMQQRLLMACTAGGLLGWKLLSMTGGGGGCSASSYPVVPPGNFPANLPGSGTWAFEPAALGLTACACGPKDSVSGLDRLIMTSAHQQ